MSDYVIELAKEIQRSRPNAMMPVIIWLKEYSEENIEILKSKGMKIRNVIKRLNLVTGDVKAEVIEDISSLNVVKNVTASCELEPLK
jgi:hypothetical protein